MFLNCDAKVRLFFESANDSVFFFKKKMILLLYLLFEVDHLDGSHGTFVSLVA